MADLISAYFNKGVYFMKKTFASLALLAVFLMPAQGAFAWTYDGLGSLNPFTGFKNRSKCEDKCYRPKTATYNTYQKVKIIPNCNLCSKTFNMEENCPCNRRAHY